jgi:hypothetical protein
MGTFVDQVRKGAIPQPTEVAFDIDVWRKRYEAIADKDTPDSRLFDAGVFFSGIFDRSERNWRREGFAF